MLPCNDEYATTFASYPTMLRYHELMEKESLWERCPVNVLDVVPLGPTSKLSSDPTAFASGISEEAIKNTVANLGLALRVNGKLYPLRTTAKKTLLERAKINGTILTKLTREELASVLNMCLKHINSDALILVRDEKVSATHSGDQKDYSRLPMDGLLHALERKMGERFPGYRFESGYSDHALTCGSWSFPDQKDELLDTYAKVLTSQGKNKMAQKLMPGIRFVTSDTGVASAKVSALLMGLQHPIHIGSCISVDHRYQKTVDDFEKELDLLFAQYADSVSKLQSLLDVYLNFPVNAMAQVCKKLSLPVKESAEAVAMFEMAIGNHPATAHDVFLAMQEIPYMLKGSKASEAKRLLLEENMARALSIRWKDFDYPKAVNA